MYGRICVSPDYFLVDMYSKNDLCLAQLVLVAATDGRGLHNSSNFSAKRPVRLANPAPHFSNDTILQDIVIICSRTKHHSTKDHKRIFHCK